MDFMGTQVERQSPRWLRVTPTAPGKKRRPCRLYRCWDSMKSRCKYPSTFSYRTYGARGITVCDEWMDYAVFRKWAIENGYTKDMTIDRIDNYRGYCPENCRWVTRSENAADTTQRVMLTFNGKTLPRIDWARRMGLNPGTLQTRLRNGWSVEKALTTPRMQPGRSRKQSTQDGKQA